MPTVRFIRYSLRITAAIRLVNGAASVTPDRDDCYDDCTEPPNKRGSVYEIREIEGAGLPMAREARKLNPEPMPARSIF